MVDGLASRQLVIRQHDEDDRRRIGLELTGEGRRLLAAADAEIDRRLRDIADYRPDGTAAPFEGLEPWREALDRLPDRTPIRRSPGRDSPRRGGGVSATTADRRPTLPGTPTAFVPIGIESRYRPPRATIDSDKSKSWIGRAWPVVMSHKKTLFTALTLSFVALLLQVQIPNLLNEAISNSLQRHAVPLSHYVTLVLVLAVAAGISAFISRLFLLRTAYAMEFDLRNIIYSTCRRCHSGFTTASNPGQLISRANSDIRSVQMYLTFGPSILVQCAVALVAFAYMLSINVPLAFVAMSTTPLVYFSSVRMRREIFPVSWLIQSRLADVATIVDENINGVRVVKSFVAEPRELRTLAQAAERLKWAYIKDADIRARFTPTVQNLPQLGLALVLLFGGWLVIHGDLKVGAILAFSAYIVMLQAPFQLLGMLIMLGQRAKASAGRIYQILDEAARDRR